MDWPPSKEDTVKDPQLISITIKLTHKTSALEVGVPLTALNTKNSEARKEDDEAKNTTNPLFFLKSPPLLQESPIETYQNFGDAFNTSVEEGTIYSNVPKRSLFLI